jgi:hypothetical protein
MAKEIVTRETISITQTEASENDRALSAEFTRLGWKAIAAAERFLDFGSADERLAITKTMMTTMSRLAAVDNNSMLEDHRNAFLAQMTKMTTITESTPIIEPTGAYDSLTHDPLPAALTRRPINQDDLPRD